MASGQWPVNPKFPIPSPKSPIPPLRATSHYPLFTIKTPTATVTDLGTEFGVEVEPTGATSASVFRGVIEVQSFAGTANTASHSAERKRIGGVEKDSSGRCLVVRRGAADPAAFVRVDSFPRRPKNIGSRHSVAGRRTAGSFAATLAAGVL